MSRRPGRGNAFARSASSYLCQLSVWLSVSRRVWLFYLVVCPFSLSRPTYSPSYFFSLSLSFFPSCVTHSLSLKTRKRRKDKPKSTEWAWRTNTGTNSYSAIGYRQKPSQQQGLQEVCYLCVPTARSLAPLISVLGRYCPTSVTSGLVTWGSSLLFTTLRLAWVTLLAFTFSDTFTFPKAKTSFGFFRDIYFV